VSDHETSRRNLLSGVAAAGVALPVLAACGSGGNDVTGSTGSDATPPGDPTASGGSSPSGIKTSEIPVGGGKVFAGQKIVVTQPKAGEFKAFSAVCTHQGCLVSRVASGKIDCPCHGSQYSIEDGAVEGGPAPKPLPAKTVTVSPAGDTLTVS
jgi:Rieske Fe-S protein